MAVGSQTKGTVNAKAQGGTGPGMLESEPKVRGAEARGVRREDKSRRTVMEVPGGQSRHLLHL